MGVGSYMGLTVLSGGSRIFSGEGITGTSCWSTGGSGVLVGSESKWMLRTRKVASAKCSAPTDVPLRCGERGKASCRV